jgi:integrase
VALLGVTSGLRPGELLGLHWGDVTLDGPEPHLTVRQSLSLVGGAALKAPKRPRSYRVVPLTPEGVAGLRAWRIQQAIDRSSAADLWRQDWPGLLFTEPDGSCRRIDSYRRAMTRAIAVANKIAFAAWVETGGVGPSPAPLPHCSPHALRHTFATYLIEAGVPIAHVAELLGDTVATVESTYSHVLRPKHEVAALVSSILGREVLQNT